MQGGILSHISVTRLCIVPYGFSIINVTVVVLNKNSERKKKEDVGMNKELGIALESVTNLRTGKILKLQ